MKCHFGEKNLTRGFSATYFAQFLISRMASILVSGKAALQANSDRHLTASWNESITATKCLSKTLAVKEKYCIFRNNKSKKPMNLQPKCNILCGVLLQQGNSRLLESKFKGLFQKPFFKNHQKYQKCNSRDTNIPYPVTKQDWIRVELLIKEGNELI